MTKKKRAADGAVAHQATAQEPTIIAVKGFAADWTCRGFAYEIGKTYTHDGSIAVCEAGFHACHEHPLAVFSYYAPAGSRFAAVSLGGATDSDGDGKIAAAKITIDVELSIGDLVKRAWNYVWSRCTIEEGGHATGTRGAAQASGDQGAAQASGYRGAAQAMGDRGAAMASGHEGRVKGATGNALFLIERNTQSDIVAVWAGIAGQDGVKHDVWYTLRDGKPVEA